MRMYGRRSCGLLNHIAAFDRRLICITNIQRLFGEYIRINQRLNDVAAGYRKRDVGKDSHVVRKTIGRDLEWRRSRYSNRLDSVRCQDSHFGKVLAFAGPVVQDDQLEQRHRQLWDLHCVEDAHQTQLVIDFDSDVFAEYCVVQPKICRSFLVCHPPSLSMLQLIIWL